MTHGPRDTEPRLTERTKSDGDLRIVCLGLLGGALLLRGLGLAHKYLWADFETETPIFEVLLFDIGVAESYALSVDNTGTWCYLIAAIIVLVAGIGRGFCKYPAGRRIASAALLFCILWELLIVLATLHRGGLFMVRWTPATHALRFATPLALLVILNSYISSEGHISSERIVPAGILQILRVAIAATFVGHGVQAIFLDPQYVTLLVASMSNLVGWSMSQLLAERTLCCIGVIDLLLASLILTARWRWIAIYMAAWGGFTALSRMTAGGWTMWPEVVLRASHFAGPLVVLAYWSAQDQAREAIVSLDWEHADEPPADSRST